MPRPPLRSPLRRRLRAACRTVALAAVAAAVLGPPVAVAQAPGATAPASPWRAVLIVSGSGAGALGQRHLYAAERAVASAGRSGIFGQPIALDVVDDRGDVRRAEDAARAAIDEGALVVICCTTAAATDRVARLAEDRGVLLLALDAARPIDADWTMQLAPSARTVMTAAAVHAATEGKSALALMTVDTTFGDDAEASFARAMLDTGREGVGVVRYAPSERTLTPEGLQTAAYEPGAVIVWGLAEDTPRALDGLRRRGFLGPVYVRPASVPEASWRRTRPLDAVEGPLVPSRDDPWSGVRTAVAPIVAHEALPPEHPNAAAVAEALARLGGPGGRTAAELADMALVDDAVRLAIHAMEGVAALGLPPDVPTVGLRLAVRDALHGGAPLSLAAGTYAPRAGDSRAARWNGLVMVVFAH